MKARHGLKRTPQTHLMQQCVPSMERRLVNWWGRTFCANYLGISESRWACTETMTQVYSRKHHKKNRIKIHISRVFTENGLKLTLEATRKIIDFLSVTLNLSKGILSHTQSLTTPCSMYVTTVTIHHQEYPISDQQKAQRNIIREFFDVVLL